MPTQRLGFDLVREQQVDWAVPTIDGISLIKIVSEYELSVGYEPAGSYAGLVPSFFNFGRLDEHYEGRGLDAPQTVLLGCECGESGCWPLMASVTTKPGYVTWGEFNQPHRPDWDYAGMETFRFERWQFDKAVQDLLRRLGPAARGERA